MAAPSTRAIESRRQFWWGARHKWGGYNSGRLFHDKVKRSIIAKDSYHFPRFERRLLLKRCLPAQGWRGASHWRDAQAKWSQKTTEKELRQDGLNAELEDWYTRWEKQRRERYDEFVKRIEEDPFTALFGRSNRWLGWVQDNINQGLRTSEASAAANSATASKTSGEATQAEKSRQKRGAGVHTKPSNATESRLAVKKTTSTEYEIDPITLRKVPKVVKSETSSDGDGSAAANNVYNVPVKTYKASDSADNRPTKYMPSYLYHGGTAQTSDLLRSEGLKNTNEPHSTVTTSKNSSLDVDKSKRTRIESALDRHLRHEDTESQEPTRGLTYEAKENKTEGVDLLRASDVRASAGITGRQPIATGTSKALTQGKLDVEFDKRPSQLEERLQEEIDASSTNSDLLTVNSKDDNLQINRLDAHYMNQASDTGAIEGKSLSEGPATGSDGPEKLTASMNQKSKFLQAKMVPLKIQIDRMRAEYERVRSLWLAESRALKMSRAQQLHEDEVKAQKSAMEAMEARCDGTTSSSSKRASMNVEPIPGEGDVAMNVHEFADRSRWYKRKAPHAKDEMDAKYERLARDKALIREIRGIYEDTYGTIDTNHRQMTLSAPAEAPAPQLESSQLTLLKEDPLHSILGRSGEPEFDKASSASQPTLSANTDLEAARSLLRELSVGLEKLDILLQASIKQIHGATSTSFLVKSSAIKSIMGRIFQRAAEIATTAPALRSDLFESVSAAAKLCWSANNLLVERTMSIMKTESQRSLHAQQMEAEKRANVQPPADSAIPTAYRILAYDLSTQRLTSAKTTSLEPFENERHLRPLEALTKLNNPGKFLPQVMSLHNKGYDIVAGAPDVLVLKKVRQPIPPEENDHHHRSRSHLANPIDGMISPAAANYASPTGFVNHEFTVTPEELEQYIKRHKEEQAEEEERQRQQGQQQQESGSQTTSSPATAATYTNLPPDASKVRREEPVFSGLPRRHQHAASSYRFVGGGGGGHRRHKKERRDAKRSKRRALRRMLVMGVVTAAMCYAVGVAVEEMGGGVDGGKAGAVGKKKERRGPEEVL